MVRQLQTIRYDCLAFRSYYYFVETSLKVQKNEIFLQIIGNFASQKVQYHISANFIKFKIMAFFKQAPLNFLGFKLSRDLLEQLVFLEAKQIFFSCSQGRDTLKKSNSNCFNIILPIHALMQMQCRLTVIPRNLFYCFFLFSFHGSFTIPQFIVYLAIYNYLMHEM